MRKWAAFLLIIGLVGGFTTGIWRYRLEQNFNRVELAVDLDDLPAEFKLAQLHEWGVQSLVLTAPLGKVQNGTMAKQAQEVKEAGFSLILKIGTEECSELEHFISASYLDGLLASAKPHVVLSGISQVPGYPHEIPQVAELLHHRQVRFGIQEFAQQSGEQRLAQSAPLHVVRVHTIYPKELPHYDPDKSLTRFIRAVRERSYRLLYIRSSPGSTAIFTKELGDILKSTGFKLGPASSLPLWQNGLGLFAAAVCGWLGASLMLWDSLKQETKRLPQPIQRFAKHLIPGVLTGVSIFLVVYYIFRHEILSRQILALLAALTFPGWAVLPQRWIDGKREQTLTNTLWFALREFAAAAAISLSGAAIIGAALGDFRFMMKIVEFRGVKAMSILPIGFVALCAFGRTLEIAPWNSWLRLWKNTSLWLKVAGLFVGLLTAVVYIGRTGNFIIPVPDWELRMREFLEAAFLYRPRTKEIFIGHPFLIVGLGLHKMGFNKSGLWLTVLGTVGQISLVNTFTHIHASLHSAVSRTFSGLLVGGGLGFMMLVLLMIMKKIRDHRLGRQPS